MIQNWRRKRKEEKSQVRKRNGSGRRAEEGMNLTRDTTQKINFQMARRAL